MISQIIHRLSICLVLSLFSIGCNKPTNTSQQDIANNIKLDAANKISEQLNLDFVGIGGGGDGTGKIRMFILMFKNSYPIQINQARLMLINSTQIVLNNVNHNQEIEKYLTQFPFTEKNVEIRILSRNKENNTFQPPNIANFSQNCGRLDYYVKKDEKLKLFHKESYEEALEKIKEETKKWKNF